MNESQFGFEYSWQDLRPVRPLFLTLLTAQFAGIALGLVAARHLPFADAAAAAGALASLPGYLLGLLVQLRAAPQRIGEHAVMVRRIGLVAAMLSAVGLYLLAGTGFAL